ncbi:MAG TPA: hypothetical protein VI702_03265 [Nitrospiria bacterium]
MKSIARALILLAMMSTSAAAAEIKFGGEFRARGFYDNNLTDVHTGGKDEESFSDARFRLKIMAKEGLATGVLLADFFDGGTGADAATLNTPNGGVTGNRILGSDGFGRSLDSIRLKEAYLKMSWPFVNFIVGRQPVTLGHGLILDDTADSVAMAVPLGWATLTFVQMLLETVPENSQDTTAYLVNLNIVPSSVFRSGFFAMLLRDRGPNLTYTPGFSVPPGLVAACATGPNSCALSDFGDANAALGVFGWSMDYKASAFYWATELDYLKGSIRTDLPTADNPAGDDIDLFGANALMRLGWRGPRLDSEVTGLYATGQKLDEWPAAGGSRININAISPNFRLGNILVNNETTSDRDGGNIGGISAVKLALGWRSSPAFRTELSGIGARLTEEPDSNGRRNLGWELDADTYWQLDPNLLLISGFGLLFPGDAWQSLLGNAEAKDHMVKLSTKIVYTF